MNIEDAEPGVWYPIDKAPHSYYPPLSHINHHAPQILALSRNGIYYLVRWGGPSKPCWIDGEHRPVEAQLERWQCLPKR